MDVSSFLLQSGAVAAFSLTVTRSELFKPARKFKLFRCPYCFSHWAALAVTINYQPYTINLPIYWFGYIAASALIMGAIMRLLLMQESRISELELELDEATTLLREIR